MTTTNELSWKVDLYVSASSSGKVNPLTDTIGSAALPWVGSVLYDNWYNTWEGGQVYVQTNYTNNRTGLISETLTPITLGGYTSGYKVGTSLPTTYKLGSDDTSYPIKDGSGRDSGMTVYHRAIDCGLPSEMEKITSANYKTLVQDKVESNDFMSKVLDHINEGLNASGSTLFSRVKSLVKSSPTVSANMNALIASGANDATIISALRPDNPDCVVEWVAVVVPMTAWSETSGGAYDYSCWEVNNGSNGIGLLGGDGTSGIRLALDSFYSAQLNHTTKQIYENTKLANYYAKHVTITESMANGYASRGKLRYGISNGYQSAEKYYENLASCAHDTHDSTTYCGVYTSKGISTWSDDNMALYGGITVYKSEKKDNSIPVYYYITPTPNDPILPPSTATPPTFTPNPPAGTKVKKVVYPTDNSLVVPNNPPQDFPDPLPSNPPYTEITPTDGTYPIDPDNPPSHILVECVQTDIPIYYHVFTFTNTTGNDYKDVFEYLKDNPSVRESAAVENITAVGTTPILADGTKSTYTPQSSSSGTIVAVLSTSGTNLGNTWSWLTQQGSTQLYKRMCSYKALQACIVLL